MAIAVLAGSCLPDPVFVCTTEEECIALGDGARCEAVQYCSTEDQNCASGRRFHAYAGDGLAGLCTDVTCGDGDILGDELCDDGNDVDGDGCNNDCRPSGTEVWAVTHASESDVRDRCYSVAVDSRGWVNVIGHTSTLVEVDGMTVEQADIWVRQYAPDGTDAWTWVLDGADNIGEEGWSVEVVDDDNLLVAGSLGTDTTLTDAWAALISRDGALIAEASHDGEAAWIDAARGAVMTADGDIIAIGYATTISDRETDLWFQRRNLSDGTIDWTQHRPGFPDMIGQWAQDRGHGIAVVPTGYVAVGVRQGLDVPTGEYSAHHWVEHFDDRGTTQWSDQGAVDDRQSVLTAVAPTPSGDVLLAGWRADEMGGDANAWLQRRDPGGRLVWELDIESPSGDEDKANAIVAAGDDGFIVAGELGNGTGSTDAWIARYADAQTMTWQWTLSGPSGDRDTAWGLDVAPDGSIYACGYASTPGTEWDIWVRRFTP